VRIIKISKVKLPRRHSSKLQDEIACRHITRQIGGWLTQLAALSGQCLRGWVVGLGCGGRGRDVGLATGVERFDELGQQIWPTAHRYRVSVRSVGLVEAQLPMSL